MTRLWDKGGREPTDVYRGARLAAAVFALRNFNPTCAAEGLSHRLMAGLEGGAGKIAPPNAAFNKLTLLLSN